MSEERNESAKKRLQDELHQFLAGILASDAAFIASLATKLKDEVEKKGIDAQFKLAGDVEARIGRIEEVLRQLPDANATALDVPLGQFREDMRKAIRQVATEARDVPTVRIRRDDDAADGRDAINIQLKPPASGLAAWLAGALALLSAAAAITALFMYLAPPAPQPSAQHQPSGTETIQAPQILVVGDTAERGWKAFLAAVQGNKPQLGPAAGLMMCEAPAATAAKCGSLDAALRRWVANPLLGSIAAGEVKVRAASLCPAVSFDDRADRRLDYVLECLNAAGAERS